MRRSTAVLLSVLSGVGCDAPTLLRVRITSQFQVPGELAGLRLTIAPEGVDTAGLPSPLPGELPFGLDLPVRFNGEGAHAFEDELWVDVVPYPPLGADHDVRITVAPDVGAGCENPRMPGVFGEYAPLRVLRRFVPGAIELVHVDLSRDCCGVSCGEGLYCSRGQCIPEDGRCDDPTTVTIPCGQGVCERAQPRCLLGRVNDCAGQAGDADLSQCGVAPAAFPDGDCDGVRDTGSETVQYRDVDEDGYGDASTRTARCGLAVGWVTRSDDCDDRTASIHPDAAEACDAVDQDCDGALDEGVTRACASMCGPGTEYCTAGVFGGCDARLPGRESCNGLDDDCDGVVDQDPICVGCIDFPDIDVYPFLTTNGDLDLDCCNDGPTDTPRITVNGFFTTPSTGTVAARFVGVATEENGDYTQGVAEVTVTRSAGRAVDILSPTFSVQYLDMDHFIDDAFSEAVFLDRGDGAVTGVTCSGDVPGDEICVPTGCGACTVCTRCTVRLGCVRVRYRP